MGFPMTSSEDTLHAEVDALLVARGFKIADGLPQAISQTGQRYKQKIVLAKPGEMAGSIADFVASTGHPGDTVYWRIRADRTGDRAYIRFLVSSRPVIPSEGERRRAAG